MVLLTSSWCPAFHEQKTQAALEWICFVHDLKFSARSYFYFLINHWYLSLLSVEINSTVVAFDFFSFSFFVLDNFFSRGITSFSPHLHQGTPRSRTFTLPQLFSGQTSDENKNKEAARKQETQHGQTTKAIETKFAQNDRVNELSYGVTGRTIQNVPTKENVT